MFPLLLLACTAPETGDDTATPTGSDVVALVADGLDHPVDAAPTPDGSTFWFVTDGAVGPGLYGVPADGSAAPTLVNAFSGARGLVVSADGDAVYLTADDDAGDRVIWEVHVDGSGVTAFTDTVGLEPGGLVDLPPLTRPSHNCRLFFTGGAGMGATAGGTVWSYPPGETPTVLADGFGGGVPQALEAGPDGALYVSVVDPDGTGSLWHIPADRVEAGGDPGTAATRVTGGWIPGEVPGIAVTVDGSTMLVSSLSAQGTSQVVLVDLATATTTVFDDVIRENDASGGVHRARELNVFAWADSASGTRGSVYGVHL